MPLAVLLAAARGAPKGPLDSWSPTMLEGFALFLPLIALIVILGFTIESRRLSAWVSILFTFGSLVLSLIVLAIEIAHPLRLERNETFLQFFTGQSGVAAEFRLEWGVVADPLAAVWLCTVVGISLLIQIYSLSYLRREEGLVRFFCAVAFSTFAAMGLTVSTNYFEFLLFWGLLGISSYLLIAHLWRDPLAAAAARKTLLVTGIGDAALIAGIIYIFFRFHDFRFSTLATSYTGGKVGANGLLIMALLIFAAAAARAAQFPLHVWLPDAVEAPAPAAALICSVTMAVSGVYLVARAFPLFAASPRALMVMAVVGGFTAVVAALSALAEGSLKRLLAYATISELGLVMLALGAGAYTAGAFHLFTHAFTTALLFLGAGSILLMLRTDRLEEMGGLWRRMGLTGWTMLIGALASAGIVPLSGFWSKEAILSRMLQQNNSLAVAVVVAVTFLSALYLSRMMFLVFGGETARRRRFDPDKIREPGGRMGLSMFLLAVLSAGAGIYGIPGLKNGFLAFMTYPKQPVERALSTTPVLIVIGAGVAGLLLGWILFRRRLATRLPIISPVARIFANGFYLDRGYTLAVERGLLPLSAAVGWVDRRLIDGFFDSLGASVASATRPRPFLANLRFGQLALAIFAGLLLLGLIAVAVSTPGVPKVAGLP
jgi:NADH-quinone oxidoreductase subunit L